MLKGILLVLSFLSLCFCISNIVKAQCHLPSYSNCDVPEATSGFRHPLNVAEVTPGYTFGQRTDSIYCAPVYGTSIWLYHPGRDINAAAGDADLGTPVYATAAGRVVYVNGTIWAGVVIQHYYKGSTWYSHYAHVQNIKVTCGQIVSKGDQVAEIGKVGASSAHLHFEIRKSSHPDPINGDYFCASCAGHPCLQILNNVTNWYEDPIPFINSHSAYNPGASLSAFVTPSITFIPRGGQTSFQITVQSINRFNGPVSLTVSGLPPGASYTPATVGICPSGSAVAWTTITTNSSTSPANYTLTFTLTAAGIGLTTRSTAVLAVTAPPGNVVVNAKLNGFSWPVNASGAVNYSLAGPQNSILATSVPNSFNNLMPGQYRLTYISGGPGTFVSISPSNLQNLPSASTIAFTLNFIAPLNFSLSSTPNSATVTRGQTATYTISIRSVNNFNQSVTLSALNLPGTVLSGTGFIPQAVNPGPGGLASSTLRIVTNNSTPRGTFTITIRGISGSLTNQIPITLTVR